MRKVLLAAMVCVMAICIGCQPSLPEKCDGGAKDKSAKCCDHDHDAKCDHDHDAKCDHDHDKAEAKDASTISPELKEKAITRIKEIQGTYVEKDGAIVEVDIMNKSFEPADVELIAQLSDVVKLSISSPSVNDQNFALLSKMPKLQTLLMLNCGITDEGLKSVPDFPELKVLNLRGCANMTDAGMESVAKAPKLDNLALLYTKIGDEGVIALKGMKLRALDLRGLRLTGSACQALAEMTTLESLKLRNAREIMDYSFQELKTLVNLKSLSLEDLAITDSALEILPNFTNLKELVIMRTDMMDVSPIGQLKNLKKLTLREMTCDLDFLAEMPQLEELFFAESIVRDEDMKFFEGLVNIKTLDLWNTQLGDKALELFGKMPKLTTLNIKNCAKISDAGIAELAKSESLESLNLSENGKATDDDGKPLVSDKALESLKGCKSLKELNIYLCPSLTEDAIKAFTQARPDVKVISY
ncbi:MAG: hypothetical protein IJH67_02860 [Thermoguttaceae bacterium]|nr:hypothetical protein [Thermoguttaceae bacterium]